MKFKIILISVGVITSVLSGLGFNYYNQTNGAEKNANITENVVLAETNEIQENPEEKNEVDNEVNQEVIEEKTEDTVVVVEPKTQENNQKETTAKPQTTQTTTQKSPEIKQEEPRNSTPSVQETPKVEEKKPTTPTQSDLEYWCISGGNHHVAGDGANEHGYYSSWDQANSAFENYTKGWASVQYKISQCPCGLYYFWAIQ